MGSSRLVTAKVTYPPESSQQPADIIQQSAASSQEPAAAMSSGRRSVSWVNIPITRTVDTMMASVVEELQQQQPGQQQQQQQLLARWWRPQRLETGQSPPVPQHPAHLGVRSPVISMQMQSNKCINCYLSTCNKINVE